MSLLLQGLALLLCRLPIYSVFTDDHCGEAKATTGTPGPPAIWSYSQEYTGSRAGTAAPGYLNPQG